MVTIGYLRNSHIQKTHLVKHGISQYYDVMQTELKKKCYKSIGSHDPIRAVSSFGRATL